MARHILSHRAQHRRRHGALPPRAQHHQIAAPLLDRLDDLGARLAAPEQPAGRGPARAQRGGCLAQTGLGGGRGGALHLLHERDRQPRDRGQGQLDVQQVQGRVGWQGQVGQPASGRPRVGRGVGRQ
jgi:hypothetical protein